MRCAHCGEIVGVYEPAVWRLEGGRVVVASLLGLESDHAEAPVRSVVHDGCSSDAVESDDEPVERQN